VTKNVKKEKKTEENTTTVRKERAPHVSAQALLGVLTLKGVDALEEALNEYKPSLPVLRKLREFVDFAVAEKGSALHGNERIVAVLANHCSARGLGLVPGRGKAPPSAGEKRRYRVQHLEEGAPFLRLPMSSLGCQKGDEVVASFEDGRIVVTPAKSAGGA
jgi:hypothetical protein